MRGCSALNVVISIALASIVGEVVGIAVKRRPFRGYGSRENQEATEAKHSAGGLQKQ